MSEGLRAFKFGDAGRTDDDRSAEALDFEKDLILTQRLKECLRHRLDELNGSDVFARGGKAQIRFHRTTGLIALFDSKTRVNFFDPLTGAVLRSQAAAEPMVVYGVQVDITGLPRLLNFAISGYDSPARGATRLGFDFDPNTHDLMAQMETFHGDLAPEEVPGPDGPINIAMPKIHCRTRIEKNPSDGTFIVDYEIS